MKVAVNPCFQRGDLVGEELIETAQRRIAPRQQQLRRRERRPRQALGPRGERRERAFRGRARPAAPA
jgi:hypothetical protein